MMRCGRRPFLLLSGAAAAGWAAGPAFGARRGFSTAVLAALRDRMAADKVPGLSIAAVEDGGIAWTEALGVRDLSTGTPVEDDTIFLAASLSKPVFAFVVLQAVEAGRLDLDAPLVGYLPRPDLPADPRMARVTARHVLSHTTGWQNWRFGKDAQLAFKSDPGATFGYSGEGIYYLQEVLEKVTRTPLAVLMRTELLEPLGMTSSSYAWRPGLDHRRPTYYRANGQAQVVDLGPFLQEIAVRSGKPLERWTAADLQPVVPRVTEKAWPDVKGGFPSQPTFYDPNAAGSLRTTARDYARFLVRMLGGHDRRGSKDDARRMMLTPQVKVADGVSWGLGWGLETIEGRECFWHWGEHFAYRTFAFGDPARRRGVVVLTNSGAGAGVCAAVVEAFTGTAHPALAWLARV